MTLFLYSKQQAWRKLQARYYIHKELIQWITAGIVALIIAGIVAWVVRAMVPL